MIGPMPPLGALVLASANRHQVPLDLWGGGVPNEGWDTDNEKVMTRDHDGPQSTRLLVARGLAITYCQTQCRFNPKHTIPLPSISSSETKNVSFRCRKAG